MKILFQLTGSIACYKACSVISRLAQSGYEVKTVATESALKFVGEATLEGLTAQAVTKNVFSESAMMDHIHLARWADLLVVCPATANTINSLAAGLANDIVGSLFLANNLKKPYWVVPAMNVEMMDHPATQKSLKTLSDWGVRVVEGAVGPLACGEYGKGRLVEPEVLIHEIFNAFPLSKKHSTPSEVPRDV